MQTGWSRAIHSHKSSNLGFVLPFHKVSQGGMRSLRTPLAEAFSQNNPNTSYEPAAMTSMFFLYPIIGLQRLLLTRNSVGRIWAMAEALP